MALWAAQQQIGYCEQLCHRAHLFWLLGQCNRKYHNDSYNFNYFNHPGSLGSEMAKRIIKAAALGLAPWAEHQQTG
jgi:hypothetical protein